MNLHACSFIRLFISGSDEPNDSNFISVLGFPDCQSVTQEIWNCLHNCSMENGRLSIICDYFAMCLTSSHPITNDVMDKATMKSAPISSSPMFVILSAFLT